MKTYRKQLLQVALLTVALIFPAPMMSQNHRGSNQNTRTERPAQQRQSSSNRPAQQRQSSSNRPAQQRQSSSNRTDRPQQRPTNNQQQRPNNRPNNNKPNNNRPDNNRPNNRPNNNRPDNNRPNNRPNNNRPDNNRPNNRPNNNRPNNNRPSPGHNKPEPPRHSHNWSRPVPPPPHPHRFVRPIPRRPVTPPIGYRPYAYAPSIRSILGITFGTLYNSVLDYLFYNNYTIDGYADNVVYLSDVALLNHSWPYATLYCNDLGQLASAQFSYHVNRYNMSRYNHIYQLLCNTYGSPVSVITDGILRQATWYGGGGAGYTTLEFVYDNGGYYTILSVSR